MSDVLYSLLHPERDRTGRRPGWLTAVGLVLVPLLVGGLLVWALWQPTERLDRIDAAVVNQDEPVTVDGQTVPLGRQLAAALVAPDEAGTGNSAAAPTTNFTWQVTSAADAAAGLADGRFATVVTIPADFSAAATSSGTDPANARRATIDIATSQRSRPVDGAVAQAVTSTAVRVLSSQLTTTYLENVLVGFDTLRTNLQDASDGASQLASGAGGLSDGASLLSSGASSLASGVGELSSGAASLASGAATLSSGVGDLSSGAGSLASGLDRLAAGAASGAAAAQGGVPKAQELASAIDQLATGLAGLQQLAAVCGGTVTDPALPQAAACAALQQQASASGPASLAGSAAALAAGGQQLADSAATSAAGLDDLATGVQQSAAGAHRLADGAARSATGAATLSSGLASLASGAEQSADGASSLASGAGDLATGAADLGTGATGLADGLGTAVDGLPSYSADEAGRLADVVAEPVATTGAGSDLFGDAGVPFVLVVALWLGGLATFVVLGATAPRAVGSTRSSLRLAAASFAPSAAVGAVQGLVLTAAMAGVLDLTPGGWAALAAVCALAGVAFAAVNQGLVAAARGAGRFVAVVVAVVGLATAVVSTVPALLDTVAGLTPLAPARDAMQAVVAGGGVGGGVALLVVWAAVGLGLTTAAVARRRVVPAGRLARWARAA